MWRKIINLFWNYFGDSILAEDHIPGQFTLIEREGLIYIIPRFILEKHDD